MSKWTVESLREFEESIRQAFIDGKAIGAVHLSRGNETQLINIFKDIAPTDWVFSAWRSHYHALLRGIPADLVRHEIMSGRSISITSKKRYFFTSSIVGGILPIALGVALGIKRAGGQDFVWCFLGDMTAAGGAFHECQQYAQNFDLPIKFIIEDNEYSTNTPTLKAWGAPRPDRVVSMRYYYRREWPHSGAKER